MRSEASKEVQRRLSREAKRRRVGTCEDCGAATRYNGRTINGASRLCCPCANRRIGHAKRGTGFREQQLLAFLGDETRGFMEIVRALQLPRPQAANPMLARLMKYGLVERVGYGKYRKVVA